MTEKDLILANEIMEESKTKEEALRKMEEAKINKTLIKLIKYTEFTKFMEFEY
jgi:hypothetical protein